MAEVTIETMQADFARFIAQMSLPDAPDTGYLIIFMNADGLFSMDSEGSLQGPFIDRIKILKSGVSQGDANTLNFVQGAGISFTMNGSVGIGTIAVTINASGAFNFAEDATQLDKKDVNVIVDTSGGDISQTLPRLNVAVAGADYHFKRISNDGNTYTISPDPDDASDFGTTIEGAGSKTLTTQYESFTLFTDANQWYLR